MTTRLVRVTRRTLTAGGGGQRMLENYLPILVFLGVGILFGVGPMVAGALLAPRQPDAEKLSPYECGFEAFAILFIIFDLEIAFLFPWAVVLDRIGVFGILAMGLFLGILVIGFIYEWKKGALEWE
jgi:NADH-quinone oxidoreductase subunit A